MAVKPQIKLLQDCKPLELIRMNVEGVTSWAIVGQRVSDNQMPILVLTEDAYCLEASDQINGIRDELNSPALSYGEFAIGPLHDADCNVFNGPLFSTPRSLVITKDDDRFVTCFLPNKAIGFFDLRTGKVRSDISLGRVAHAYWFIFAKSNIDEGALTHFTAKRTKERTKP